MVELGARRAGDRPKLIFPIYRHRPQRTTHAGVRHPNWIPIARVWQLEKSKPRNLLIGLTSHLTRRIRKQ